MLNSNFYDALAADAPNLNNLIDRFDRPRILVVGDLTLDEFLTGQVERISREAPVLIIRHEETVQVPGGGANAVYNLAKLGAKVSAVGLIGDDDQGKALRRIFTEAGIDTSGVIIDRDRPTVTKTRISGHARQSVTQQIVRIDRKSDQIPSPSIQAQLAEFITAKLPEVDAVVCSDYGEGVMMPIVIAAALQHQLTIVDAQKALDRYQGATIFTPNLPEAELAAGFAIDDGGKALDRAAAKLLALTAAKYILITRGEDGMSLFNSDRPDRPELQKLTRADVPAFNRTQVFDVTGAGDTVVSALTLALANGSSFWQATVLGNLAASIVVRQFGTTTTSAQEMHEALQNILEVE
ncbi:rfaE bifunctional protein [Thalassoporum mexicanum PCC 7367]|uniref:bifunctional heptose 7-phosphate kinase/heptose 1-phosphate adenyltransferase n=1 Tax=Thalassoporum mexicanum TaxID=3457544 RepID=UPI00029FEA8B|nr:PfkB family carbohydrate kinase [Pseudanabaena sp. PCC 7367]AFY68904.1 rfaE bifunctional protein [Pseudanabaena sp. PCC 7367]